jgi:sigma-E factor negative regulatory protein RseA
MTVNNDELLSALIDGELDGPELQQALSLLQEDDVLRARWQRYQYHRDLIQGNASSLQVDISNVVADAIESEPQHVAAKQSNVISLPEQFWKQAVSLAMAASIGALAVVGVISQPQNSSDVISPVNMVENKMSQSNQIAVVENKGNRWTVEEPEVEIRLNDYLVDHHEYVGTSGVFSYARVVSYGEGQ